MAIRTYDPRTLDDLERIAFTNGGTIEPRPGGRYVLIGALINGQRTNLGPVPGSSPAAVAS